MERHRAVERDPDRTLPHLVVSGIAPAVREGRYAVKRLVGDQLRIGADIFTDGHDTLAARALVHGRPASGGRTPVPMTYSFEDDRWYATCPLDRVGEWRFTVEGWVDRFATWRGELEKKADAGHDVASELLEGAEQVREAEPHARGADHGRLAHYAALLADASADRAARVAAGLSPELQALMAAHGQPYGLTRADGEFPVRADRREAGFAAWYEFFPRSSTSDPARHGTFRDAERALPRIASLGFDVVYLPPIHPIGHTHRKGPNNALVAAKGDPGSPWAIGNEDGGHTAVNPALGTLADFRRFVEAARGHGMEVALDYALQCSPDHPWVREHPDWFFIRPDGTIKYAENPPKKYEDIYPINFWCDERAALWDACRDIFLFWIAQGVRTFRVDNPHTKPFAFWEWVIGEVQREHPDTVFLAEAFTRPKRMQALAQLGFTQSYTYFTWRNTAAELAEYLTELSDPAMADFFRGNFFANTPDILHEYLQHGGRPAFRTRLLARGHAVAGLRDLQRIRAVRERAAARGERGVSRLREVPGAGARLGRARQPRRRHRPAQPDPPRGARAPDGDQRELPRERASRRALLPEGRVGAGPALRGVAQSARGRRGDPGAAARAPRRRGGGDVRGGGPADRRAAKLAGRRQSVVFDPSERAGYIWRVVHGGSNG